MKKKILIIKLCLLIPFFLHPKDILFLSNYKNLRGDIEIQYPSNWYVKEDNKSFPYILYLSKQGLLKNNSNFKTGIIIKKYFHQGVNLGYDEDNIKVIYNDLFDKYCKSINDYIILFKTTDYWKSQMIIKCGVKILNKNQIIIKYYILVSDVFFDIECICLDNEYESYENFFLNFLSNNFGLFYVKNYYKFDYELINKLYKIKNLYNFKEKMNKISTVLNLCPNHPFTLITRSKIIYEYLKNLKKFDKYDAENINLINISIKDLNDSIIYLIKYGKYFDSNSNSIISNSYFYLGNIYFYLIDDIKKAKEYYDISLKYNINLESKKMLRNYFKNK